MTEQNVGRRAREDRPWSTSRLAVAAAVGTALVAVLVLFSADDMTGAGMTLASGWVIWFLVVIGLPAAIIGYVIGLLRNIAADGRASRLALEANRHELEAIRHELSERRAAEGIL